jgi:hypothetical protein
MKFSIFTFLLFNAFFVLAQDNKPWKFVKEVDGIKTYYRAIPNSNINEVKIQTTINSNLSTIIEVLIDVPTYKKWAYKVTSSSLVKTVGLGEHEYYNKIDFPWPLKDRDIVIHSKIQQNNKTKIVTSISYANSVGVAENQEMVRIKNFNSKWTFIPKDNFVLAEYVFKSDPGGNIPAWLVNLSLDEGPIKTIKGLKKILLLEKYKNINTLKIIN